MLNVFIDEIGESCPVEGFKDLSVDFVRLTLDHEKIDYSSRDVEVYVTFVDSQTIRDINKEYRQVDESTDVLSFPLMDLDQAPVLILGDIFINLEKIKDQAASYQRTDQEELALMLVHSTLHLLGYDHRDDLEEAQMNTIQDQILAMRTDL